MVSVARYLRRHEFMTNINLRNFSDFRREVELFERTNQRERFRASGGVGYAFQLLEDDRRGDELLICLGLGPPLARPRAARFNPNACPRFVIEARNSRFDVNERAHTA